MCAIKRIYFNSLSDYPQPDPEVGVNMARQMCRLKDSFCALVSKSQKTGKGFSCEIQTLRRKPRFFNEAVKLKVPQSVYGRADFLVAGGTACCLV
jgi:hypothetical protein